MLIFHPHGLRNLVFRNKNCHYIYLRGNKHGGDRMAGEVSVPRQLKRSSLTNRMLSQDFRRQLFMTILLYFCNFIKCFLKRHQKASRRSWQTWQYLYFLLLESNSRARENISNKPILLWVAEPELMNDSYFTSGDGSNQISAIFIWTIN